MDTSGPEVVGVVVAAGRAARFESLVLKQFQDLGGETVIARAIRILASRPGVSSVVVVLAEDELLGARAAAVRALPGVSAIVEGGDTRADSVRRGVLAALPARHVLVHDAARPLASPGLVDAVLDATLRHGAAVPVLPIVDTVKQDDGEGYSAGTVDRTRLRVAQTPQGARSEWLLEALEVALREGVVVTDEAEALERSGRRVALVPGDPANVKITSHEDLLVARRSLGEGGMRLRVGTGFDVHRFEEGRPLVLGGVEFGGSEGLHGHSDADVVLHAAMDAMLGAAGLGDIGVHFPPGDARFAGIASTRLAVEVAGMIREASYELINLDVTLLAERPKIRTRVEEMRTAMALALGATPDIIGLKATTLEGLGALGRGEGIACQAVALLRRRDDAS